MRIASYVYDNITSYGVVVDHQVADVGKVLGGKYPDLKAVLEANALNEIRSICAESLPVIELGALNFLPTIPNPTKIICIGINYSSHINEFGMQMPEYPWIFTRYPDSLTGHRQSLFRPSVSEQFDFEGELALIIGRNGRNIKNENAMEYIAGYSCFNDGSVRDFQNHTDQYTPGKNFWRSGSFGPWLVTADEIPDPSTLTLETRLNGNVMQNAPISDLYFNIPFLINYCSTFTELNPGDVIITGTPGGVGFARTPPVWLKPGDTLEVEITDIGVLSNTVIQDE
jgi:2-keto-4-pentenoate hydratase/2-oxohepta-3-ene-1,7-dioic acid hydratase in catechol pathway